MHSTKILTLGMRQKLTDKTLKPKLFPCYVYYFCNIRFCLIINISLPAAAHSSVLHSRSPRHLGVKHPLQTKVVRRVQRPLKKHRLRTTREHLSRWSRTSTSEAMPQWRQCSMPTSITPNGKWSFRVSLIFN